MIKINKIDKYYNRKKPNEIHVIDGTSLDLPDTGLIALLGKSGSGKTTLLNVIGGLDKYDSGSIELDNIKIEKYNPKVLDEIRSKKIGYIFQNYFLINDKTVYENLEISLSLAGLQDKAEIDKRIDYALSLVGLLKYKKRTPNTLSGGQQQRVGIARAIVKGPSIIIADEPTGNLDSDNTFAIMDILKSISKTCLVILVTHEEEIANFFADRIVKLKDGKIVDDFINDSNDDLAVYDNKKIFLKDLKIHKEIKAENFRIDYHGDSDNETSIKLIIKDEKLYIDTFNSSIPVLLIDEKSEIKAVDAKYEDKKKGVHKTAEIDKEILKPVKGEVKGSVIGFFESFKNAWKDYLKTPLKQKVVIHLLLFIITVIMTFIGSSVVSAFVFDESSYRDNKNLISLNNFSGSHNQVKIKDIDGGMYLPYGNVYFEPLLNVEINLMENGYMSYPQRLFERVIGNALIYPETLAGDYKVLYGTETITDTEVLIDIKIAEDIIELAKYSGITEKDILLGEKVTFDEREFVIKGIIDSGFKGAFLNQAVYDNIISSMSEEIFPGGIIYADDKEALKNWACANGYSYEDDYQEVLNSFNTSIGNAINVIVIVIIISILMLYLITSQNIKASFINKIKEIGTYRCIGVKKWELMKSFIFESFFTLNFSALIGVLVSAYFIDIFFIKNFNEFHSSFLYFLIAGVLIYAINIGLTIFKVYNLLLLTPAEITAKYDI